MNPQLWERFPVRMQLKCLVTYPCPAKNPRLEGLTLSLNTTNSMLWHLCSEDVTTGEHSSTTHHWSAASFDVPLTCWSWIDMGLKKASAWRSGRSVKSKRWYGFKAKCMFYTPTTRNETDLLWSGKKIQRVTNLLSSWFPFWTQVLWDPWWI